MQRLGQEVVAAGRQAVLALRAGHAGRNGDNDRGSKFGLLAQAPGSLEAIHPRHHQVHKDHIRLHASGGLQALFTTGCQGNLETQRFEHQHQNQLVIGIIIHHQSLAPSPGIAGWDARNRRFLTMSWRLNCLAERRGRAQRQIEPKGAALARLALNLNITAH